ncbi:phenazine biosynthesis protein [Pantoea agglomerans]|uniref:EhpE n=1 Tax=Enterobacter agglomerans TaxID=549 RepID=Q8GPH1_ENTAG|nr:EhpE [Pantoea agglomerans]MCL6413059.1 phenazine biosynthesis protein [Pantoea agglomerans]
MKRLESLTGITDLPFPQYDAPPVVPYEILHNWMQLAHHENVREPDAWTLATRSDAGMISMRTIFPVRMNGEDLWCATHLGSRKSLDMCANKAVSCHIYWRELGRQVSLTGNAKLLSDDIADQIWHSRASAYDPVSVASHQSEPLNDLTTLQAKIAGIGCGKLERPERFVVWGLAFDTYEFWSASSSRIHKRLLYTRNELGWKHERLQP